MNTSRLTVLPLFAILVLIWVLPAELVRRRWGRGALWIATALATGISVLYLVLRTRPRVYPQAPLAIALAAIALVGFSWFIAPAYSLDRASRQTSPPFIRQLGIGTLVGVATLVVGYLLVYALVFLLTRLGWSAA
jgi:hypothetical protein